jgi:glycosyltransferase involved in cell wall biosynthesis
MPVNGRLRIYYDGIIYSMYRHRPGGISNFFDHLISGVASQHDCLLTSLRPAHLPHPSGQLLAIARHNISIRPGRFNNPLRRQSFSIRAGLFRPDLIHPTYYEAPLIHRIRAPLVYTVHDMIHEKWRDQLDPTGQAIEAKRRCFEAASALPCDSESTLRDLLELYPHLEPKASVIHLAGNLKPGLASCSEKAANQQNEQYLLYVGARSSYKNFTRLALAFSRVMATFPMLRLKLVGAPLASDEVDLLNALSIFTRVDVHVGLPDAALAELYRHAIAFVYPSLYEGFGLPLLEAMAMNTPVLAANTSSIPEVASDAALLFNPWSVDSIADAILQIAGKPELGEELRRKGQRQCLRFSWDKTTSGYLNLYRQLVPQKS